MVSEVRGARQVGTPAQTLLTVSLRSGSTGRADDQIPSSALPVGLPVASQHPLACPWMNRRSIRRC